MIKLFIIKRPRSFILRNNGTQTEVRSPSIRRVLLKLPREREITASTSSSQGQRIVDRFYAQNLSAWALPSTMR